MKKIVFLLLILALTGCQFQNTAVNLSVIEPVFGSGEGNTISFDASSSKNDSTVAVSSQTWSHTVGKSANRALVVTLAIAGTTVEASGVTYAGVAMTKVRRDEATNSTEIWYLVNPAIGANNVVATFTGGTAVAISGATSYFGVDQQNPIDSQNTANGTGTTGTVDLTTVSDNAMGVDVIASNSAFGWTVGSGQTQHYNVSGSGIDSASSRELKATAGTLTMSWTIAFSTQWVMSTAALKPISVNSAYSVMAGNFAINTSGASQAIVGVGFTPEVLILTTTGSAIGSESSTVKTNSSVDIGAASSSTAEGSSGAMAINGADPMDTYNFHSTKILSVLDPANGGNEIVADLTSFDTNGFTLNVTTLPGQVTVVGFLALAGTDLTNAKVGNFTTPTSAGSNGVTGVGFKPDAVLLFSSGNTNAPDNSAAHARFMVGAIDSSLGASSASWSSKDAIGTSVSQRYASTTAAIAMSNTDDTLYLGAIPVSLDTDGFTLNYSKVQASGVYVFYVAMKGISSKVTTISSQTGTGNFSNTATSFTPSSGIFFSHNTTDSGTAIQAQAEFSLGLVSSTTERFVTALNDEDAKISAQSARVFRWDRIYANLDDSSAIDGDAGFVSWNSNGFTLNQTNADPSQNLLFAFLLGPASVAAVSEEHIGQPVIWFDTSD